MGENGYFWLMFFEVILTFGIIGYTILKIGLMPSSSIINFFKKEPTTDNKEIDKWNDRISYTLFFFGWITEYISFDIAFPPYSYNSINGIVICIVCFTLPLFIGGVYGFYQKSVLKNGLSGSEVSKKVFTGTVIFFIVLCGCMIIGSKGSYIYRKDTIEMKFIADNYRKRTGKSVNTYDTFGEILGEPIRTKANREDYNPLALLISRIASVVSLQYFGDGELPINDIEYSRVSSEQVNVRDTVNATFITTDADYVLISYFSVQPYDAKKESEKRLFQFIEEEERERNRQKEAEEQE